MSCYLTKIKTKRKEKHHVQIFKKLKWMCLKHNKYFIWDLSVNYSWFIKGKTTKTKNKNKLTISVEDFSKHHIRLD